MTIDNYLFDMDGTLTKSRSRINTNMLDLLRSLASQGSNKLYLVTGSDLTKVEEQIPYDASCCGKTRTILQILHSRKHLCEFDNILNLYQVQ